MFAFIYWEKKAYHKTCMQNRDTTISDLCEELGGITKQTLYRYVSPTGELRDYGKKLLNK